MPSNSESSSSSSFSDDGQNANSSPTSIDQSLDAIENQLASISMFKPDSLPEPEPEPPHEPAGVSRENSGDELGNGSANEIEELSPRSSSRVLVEEKKLKVSTSRVWNNVSETEELEAPASPSSSGYDGGRGSSATSGIEDANDDNDQEIVEVRSHGDSVGASDSHVPWTPGKRHNDEDDASISWRKRKKHFFILSHSGKPIYSRYGDEHKLAGFSATLQAIISFVENGGDRVKLVTAGKHQVVFLVKGPIYLVCISCTEEPYESLKGQLELLYGQMILILTKSINRCFEKNPKFDMTPLLGGTDVVFSSLIHSFSWNPATFLHAYTCLPLAYATRQAAGAILQDVADSGYLSCCCTKSVPSS